MITTLTLSPTSSELTVTHSFGGYISIRLMDSLSHTAAVVSLSPDLAARLVHLLREELGAHVADARGAK